MHCNAFRSIEIGLVGIRIAFSTRYGTKRVGIGTGCAFDADNGSFVGGVGSTGTFNARGAAGQVLVPPTVTILTRFTAVGTNVWVIFTGRAVVAFGWTG